jgi:hypothetical protein
MEKKKQKFTNNRGIDMDRESPYEEVWKYGIIDED